MILHLLTNEQFTDYAIEQFGAPEMYSEFVLIPSNHENWKVKLIDRCNIIYQNSPKFKDLLERLDQYTGIIFHGMFWAKWQRSILERVPKNVKVAWYFWGGEIYGRSDCDIPRYAPITKYITQIHQWKSHAKKIDTSWELPVELYHRVDYCLTGEAEEYEFVKKFLNHNRMQFVWYTYYDIDATVGALKNASYSGNNVIVGNSATATCNYFDVLPRLRGALKPGQKVILPLSYGSPWIRNAVSKYAKFFLKEAAMPLFEYMPRNEYNTLLQSCSVMIMDQYIPQAQGNILTGLWLGMRVYMSEKSIAYNFFKRLGCQIYSFESEFKKYGLTPLPKEEVAENRAVLMKWYSSEHVEQSVKDVVNILEGKNDDK